MQDGFTIVLSVFPTLLAAGHQMLFGSYCSDTATGAGLFLDADGCLGFVCGDGTVGEAVLSDVASRAECQLSASLPDGYVEMDRWDIGRVPSWLVGVSLVLALVALLVTANVALAVLYLTSGVAEFSLGLTSVLFGTVLGLVLHELSHAAGFLLLGGRPRFGWRARTRLGPILYVCAPGSYFSRGGYLFAGLGAVGVLTVLLLGSSPSRRRVARSQRRRLWRRA